MRVVILGAGGHAQVVADLLLAMRAAGDDLRPVGYLDDDPDRLGAELVGLPVLGALADLPSVPHDALVVAIGDNRTRCRVFDALAARGERFAVARHPRAVLAAGVRVEPGAVICAGVVVNTGAVIGANAILNTGCTVDHHGRIGPHAHVAPGVHLAGAVTVGEGAFLGIGACAIPGRAIGDWAVVGAGAAVVCDVPPGATVVGVPARIIRAAPPVPPHPPARGSGE